MATKNTKNLRGVGDYPDFTFDNVNPTVFVRFNSACVLGVHIDVENKTVQGVVIDELNETSETFEATYGE